MELCEIIHPAQEERISDFTIKEGPQNDLVRDLGFSKKGVELLGSRLKKNLLSSTT